MSVHSPLGAESWALHLCRLPSASSFYPGSRIPYLVPTPMPWVPRSQDTQRSLLLTPSPQVAPFLEQGFWILEGRKCLLLSKAVPDQPASPCLFLLSSVASYHFLPSLLLCKSMSTFSIPPDCRISQDRVLFCPVPCCVPSPRTQARPAVEEL